MNNPYYVISSDEPIAPNEFELRGMAFYQRNIIIGTRGLKEFINSTKDVGSISSLREGRFSLYRRIGNEIVAFCDDMGQDTLYYYCSEGYWAFSNSFHTLCDHLKRAGRRLALYEPSLLAFSIGNKSLFGGQLVSNNCPVAGIRMLPIGKRISVRIGPSSSAFLIEDMPPEVQYPESIGHYLSEWIGRLSALARTSSRGFVADLSGGHDSRITFGMTYRALHPSAYSLSRSGSKADDLVASDQVIQSLSIPENRVSLGCSVDSADAYDLWKAGNVGVYLPVYVPRYCHRAGHFQVGGGTFRASSYVRKSARQKARGFAKKLSDPEKCNMIREEFISSFSDIDVDIDDPEAMHHHYLHFRARAHYGRTTYRELSSVRVTPLLSRKLMLLTGRRSRDSHSQMTCNLLRALHPALAEIPFDRSEKRFSSTEIEMADSSIERGECQIREVEYRVFGTLSRESEDGHVHSYTETKRGFIELLVSDFRAFRDLVLDSGVIPRADVVEADRLVDEGDFSANGLGHMAHVVACGLLLNMCD